MKKGNPLLAFLILAVLLIAFIVCIQFTDIFSPSKNSLSEDLTIGGMRSMLHRLEDYINSSDADHLRKSQALSDLRSAYGEDSVSDGFTAAAEYQGISAGGSLITDILSTMEKSYDGYLFILDSSDGSFIYPSDGADKIKSDGDFALTAETLHDKNPEIKSGGYTYKAYYEDLHFGGQTASAVILIPPAARSIYAISCTVIAAAFIFIVVSGLILWVHWVDGYRQNHSLTEQQERKYALTRLRRIAVAGILNGTLLLFIILLAYQVLGNISGISSTNRDMLDILKGQTANSSSRESYDRNDEINWTIYFARQVAELYAAHPDLQTRDFLKSANDLFGSEFIMVFDRDGKELNSSNAWTNFTLGEEIPATADFRYLLQGVESLVLDPEDDRFTGKTLQMIGVRMDSGETEGTGAVVFAIDSKKAAQASFDSENAGIISFLTSRNNLAAVGEKQSNTVLFASDPALVGRDSVESGLKDGELSPTSLGSFDISGIKYYGAYDHDEEYDYYYMTEAGTVWNDTARFSIFSAVSFLVIALAVSMYLLDFSKMNFSEEASAMKENFQKYTKPSSLKQSASGDLQFGDYTADQTFPEWWRGLPPERKFAYYIQLLVSLAMTFGGAILMNRNEFGSRSVLNFILQGSWKRGLNELAILAILTVIVVLIYFLMVKNMLIRLLDSILDAKGETIAHLFSSLLQYAAVITAIFICLSYFGFDTGVLVTSAGILTLAVSLGSKDLIADILAGITLIFDGSFHVGDRVEVNGFTGRVVDIGVHSTKIMDIGNNLKVIGNQNVNNYLKKAEESPVTIALIVSETQPLYEIEAMLREKLPEIGAGIPEIINGPTYRGITEIGYHRVSVSIFAKCRRENEYAVKLKLNHALKELFDAHGYRL